MNFVEYIIENYELILEKTMEHISLAGISVLIACYPPVTVH